MVRVERYALASSLLSAVLSLNLWIKHFHHRYPEIQFELFEGNTLPALRAVKSKYYWLAIVRTPFHSAPFECTFLQDEPMLAVGHKIYFDACSSEHEIFLAQIYQKPLILYRRWEAIILELFQQQDLHPHIFEMIAHTRTGHTGQMLVLA